MSERLTPCLTSLLLAAALMFSASGCSELESPSEVSGDDVIMLSVAGGAAIVADGISTSVLVAAIPADASAANSRVTFQTTDGSFAGASAATPRVVEVLAVGGRAEARLQHGTKLDPLVLSAKAGSILDSETIAPVAARADAIEGDAASGTVRIGPGSPGIVLTARLTRGAGRGQVSEGVSVRFRAFQSRPGGDVSVGHFSGQPGTRLVRSGPGGTATATFFGDSGDISSAAPVTIVMSTETDAGGEIQFSLILRPA